MGVLQQHLPDELFKIPLRQFLPKPFKEIADLQIGLRLPAVKPAVHHPKPEDQSRRRIAVVPLPKLELHIRQDCFQLPVVESFLRQSPKLSEELLFHLSGVLRLQVLDLQDDPRLGYAVINEKIHVLR